MAASIIAVTILLLLGLILVGLEVFVLPGVSFAGALGGLSLLSGLVTVYVIWGTFHGNTVLIFSLLMLLVIFWIGYRYTSSDKFGLSARIQKKGITIDKNLHVGKSGYTITVLKPVGKVKFDQAIM